MDATVWDLMTFLRPTLGWQKGGERFGLSSLTSDMMPGGPNSGCPGSMSRTATPGHSRFLVPPRSVNSLFVTILENVDFPDDLGPHTSSTGTFWSLGLRILAISLFQTAGDFKSWSMAFFGPSAEDPSICHVCRWPEAVSFQRFPNTGDSLSRFLNFWAFG